MRRATGVIALVSLLTLGAFASAASADPLAMAFTEARANVGIQLSDEALFKAPDTAPFAAQINPASGSIAAGVLEVPQFSTFITHPISANVTVDFAIGIVTGSFNQATGALALSGKAGGTLAATGKECTVVAAPNPLTLSTTGDSGGTNPRSGVPFTAGLTGSGAIAGRWTNMTAAPVDSGDPEDVTFCEDVEAQIEGPGGVWLEQKGNPAPPPGTQPPIINLNPPCVVPKLAGKTLARARAALAAHGCKLGTVHRPKGLKGKRRRLVVKSFSPKAGTSPPSGEVNLRLGPQPRKARR